MFLDLLGKFTVGQRLKAVGQTPFVILASLSSRLIDGVLTRTFNNSTALLTFDSVIIILVSNYSAAKLQRYLLNRQILHLKNTNMPHYISVRQRNGKILETLSISLCRYTHYKINISIFLPVFKNFRPFMCIFAENIKNTYHK